ncbi:MAG: SH3 domain-containing C40 family peptidase [Edaphocola sp.]
MPVAMAYAVCSVSVLPLRAEPSHRAEQVSQVLFGERVEIIEENKNGWYLLRCEWDDYIGWAKKGQVQVLSYKEYRKNLHFLNVGSRDVLLANYGQFALSPGSSLFQLRKKKITWHKEEFEFKGKKLSLKLAGPSAEQVQHHGKMFIGAPYQWGGRSLLGIDCSGLTQVVYKLMNTRLPRDASEQAACGEQVAFLQEAQCGDLAFFDNEEGKINHVGILLNNHTILHATDTSGRVVIDPIDNGGIISRRLRLRTHNLRVIKRYF